MQTVVKPARPSPVAVTQPDPAAAPSKPPRDALLLRLGERVRSLRAQRGVTRRVLAQLAEVSERHLANLEAGEGNASVLILAQVARALGCSVSDLLDDEADQAPDTRLIRELLRGRKPDELARARRLLGELFGAGELPGRTARIALVGLRGAGKSTLGRLLAQDLGVPFVEMNREIERVAGCRPEQIHALYGPAAYRRYERRALDELLQAHPRAVIATPGGLVSEAATFSRLLAQCYTVWLTATPEEHMSRVVEQGDLRPMSGNREAMDDLKLILRERTPFYAKADLQFDTSGKPLERARAQLREALAAVTG